MHFQEEATIRGGLSGGCVRGLPASQLSIGAGEMFRSPSRITRRPLLLKASILVSSACRNPSSAQRVLYESGASLRA